MNSSVPELESSDVSATGSELDKSGKDDDTREDDNDDDEKRIDDNGEESQAPDTDTAASVLTILTGILESEVRLKFRSTEHFNLSFIDVQGDGKEM